MKMKPIYLSFLVFTLLASCKKDPCKKVDCGQQGYCIEGECACNAGWIFDTNSQCNERDLCYGKNCANGSCNPSTGQCECNAGWTTDNNGACTVQDLCSGVDCGAHGSCEPADGECYCESGYTKDADGKCTVEIRSRFIGTWYGTHSVNGTTVGPYSLTISEAPGGVTNVYIDNFMNSYCNSLSQPLRVIANVSDHIATLTSTWSEYNVSAFNRGIYLVTEQDMIISCTLHNLYHDGNYTRQ